MEVASFNHLHQYAYAVKNSPWTWEHGKTLRLSGKKARKRLSYNPCFTADIVIPFAKPFTKLSNTALAEERKMCWCARIELGFSHATNVSHEEVDEFLWRKSLKEKKAEFEEGSHNMAERIQLVGGFKEVAKNLDRDVTGRRCILPLVRPEDVETPPDKVMPSIMCWTFRVHEKRLIVTQLQRAIDLVNLESNFVLMACIGEEVAKLSTQKIESHHLLIMSPYGYQVH